eukprot:5752710-Pleurochrysis_carterae.AAC.1
MLVEHKTKVFWGGGVWQIVCSSTTLLPQFLSPSALRAHSTFISLLTDAVTPPLPQTRPHTCSHFLADTFSLTPHQSPFHVLTTPPNADIMQTTSQSAHFVFSEIGVHIVLREKLNSKPHRLCPCSRIRVDADADCDALDRRDRARAGSSRCVRRTLN